MCFAADEQSVNAGYSWHTHNHMHAKILRKKKVGKMNAC